MTAYGTSLEHGRFECEHRIRHADGAAIWVRNRGEVMRRDADGTPLRKVGSLCEVTEQRLRRRSFAATICCADHRGGYE